LGLALLTILALCGGAFVLYVRANSSPGCAVPRGSSACTRVVFLGNSSFFSESPVGLKFQAGLADGDASQVQVAAAATVLNDPSRWGLR
jgi:hypothetical protein